MAKKIVTSDKKRQDLNMKIFLTFLVLIAVLVGLRKVEIDPLIKIGLVVIALITALVFHKMKPTPLVPNKVQGDMGKLEKKLYGRLQRTWVKIARASGITDEERMEDGSIYVHAPRIESIESVPLGLRLVVQALPGQSTEKLADRREEIASALGTEVRTKKLTATQVEIIAEMHDALEGLREVYTGDVQDTEIRIGRYDNGEDAFFDLSEPAHVAIQGTTRSGKSALIYTILSQMGRLDNVRIWGIDPNQLLLVPFEKATDEAPTVYCGNDALRGLRILQALEEKMDSRMSELRKRRLDKRENFTAENPLDVLVLEEFSGFLEIVRNYDADLKRDERIYNKVMGSFKRILQESLKAGVRVVLITQRASVEVIPGDLRDQFNTCITLAVKKTESVRMLHENLDEEMAKKVIQFPPGRCLVNRNRVDRIMQADFTDYQTYLGSFGIEAGVPGDY